MSDTNSGKFREGQPASVESPADAVDLIEGDCHLSGVEEDRALVDRCLEGDPGAWEELYRHCHPLLLSYIKILLGGGASDPNLVDEISARVWYALIEKGGRLLARYDSRRGARLITFLRNCRAWFSSVWKRRSITATNQQQSCW